MLLVQLRWLAVGGQVATILAVRYLLGIPLPVHTMLMTAMLLVVLNLLVLIAERRRTPTNLQLLAGLSVDVACLTLQLYLSGGATNPFVTLFLLQVVLGAVLLEAWSSWLLVAVSSAAFAALTLFFRPIALPIAYASRLSPPFLFASWFNFTLAAVLLVAFVTRIAHNLRDRDARLARLRQRAVEEEHIIRMGLLASGAAHELGTPLASLSVALGDWTREPAIAANASLAAEVEDMRTEVARCKDILAGILFAAGEVTGEAPARTELRRFVGGIVADWTGPARATLDDQLARDATIVADRALAQALINLLDNAAEAGATRIDVALRQEHDLLVFVVRDDGHGFPPSILGNIGKPYQSSKDRRGAGLGLFLSTNVLRTLGGTLDARNLLSGGAEVTLRLPFDALLLEDAAS
ncbi:ATP-binding protein [Sphingomonas sp.]|uniref:ATP-binding protein n=1 Tax=Sphingomonas sp. TaxID=28214 RepID=UPI0035C7D57D